MVEAIDLPLVASTLSLPEALAVMQVYQISGVLVAVGERPQLARAEDVTDAMNRAIDAGKDPHLVQLGNSLLPPPSTPPAHLLTQLTAAVMPPSPGNVAPALKIWFEETDTDHAGITIGVAGRARLVTRSELMTFAIGSAVTLCTCKGAPVHTLTRTQVRIGCFCSQSHQGNLVKVKCSDGSCP